MEDRGRSSLDPSVVEAVGLLLLQASYKTREGRPVCAGLLLTIGGERAGVVIHPGSLSVSSGYDFNSMSNCSSIEPASERALGLISMTAPVVDEVRAASETGSPS